jgi:hypothetical protein
MPVSKKVSAYIRQCLWDFRAERLSAAPRSVENGFQPMQVQPHLRLILTNIFKTTVYVTGYAAFHSPAHFRAPEDFIPERWLSSEYDSDNKSVLQPFSLGPRNCLGKK